MQTLGALLRRPLHQSGDILAAFTPSGIIVHTDLITLELLGPAFVQSGLLNSAAPLSLLGAGREALSVLLSPSPSFPGVFRKRSSSTRAPPETRSSCPCPVHLSSWWRCPYRPCRDHVGSDRVSCLMYLLPSTFPLYQHRDRPTSMPSKIQSGDNRFSVKAAQVWAMQ